MKRIFLSLGLVAALAGAAVAQQGAVPTGIPSLNHVFVIMMENHGYTEIMHNPNAAFINSYAKSANLATNYFAIAHPSLTNYLEIVGGSNFGVLSDNPPNWHNQGCAVNIVHKTANTDTPPSPNVCPITGSGTDQATPLLDCSNEVSGPPCEIEIDNIHTIPANPNTVGMTIADQLAAAGKTWKSYQENLPMRSPDLVNYSDGNFTNLTNFAWMNPQLNPPLTSADIVQLYAVKHNPFNYFLETQLGTNSQVSYAQVSAFDGGTGLWADLASGNVPTYSLIVPNQCNDQHGRSNGTAFCNFDPVSNGTQAGLNPALIQLGDQVVQKLVTAIHQSPAWTQGNNAIVVVWDENDYSVQPIVNQVVTIVDTNYGSRGLSSGAYYNHFSLLGSIEGGLGLPCLNNACTAPIMTDLFSTP